MEAYGFVALTPANINKENGVGSMLCVRAEDISHREHLMPLIEPLSPLRQVFVEISSVFWIFVEEFPELNVMGVYKRAFVFWPCGELMNTSLTHILR